MLNLLFISNSPKMDFIKKNLQPLLKVKIDVVTDFDHGLKDVFEKRPATIIIQDQISGVTGESVARHIQMLLGSGTPVFVLMHEGNTRIKPIKGLFEHIIDLTQPDAKLVEDVQAILKTILGPEWEKIFITPKQDAAALAATFVMPAASREDADQLVDDFLSDLGTADDFGQDGARNSSLGHIDQLEEEPLVVDTVADEMVRLLVESAKHANALDVSIADTRSIQSVEAEVFTQPPQAKKKDKAPRTQKPPTRKAPVQAVMSEVPAMAEVPVATVEVAQESEPIEIKRPVPVEPKATIPVTPKSDSAGGAPQVISGEPCPAPPSPADFRISPASQGVHEQITEQIPEDLLLAFEENYYYQANNRKRLAIIGVVVIVLLGVAGWVFIVLKPDLLSFMAKRSTAPPASVPETVKSAVVPLGKLPTPSQKTISTARKPGDAVPSPLPSFMTTARRDTAFTLQKPGWERYFGKVYEYRIFRSGNNIKVVQVLAGVGDQTVSDSFLATVLKEVAGGIDYSVSSSEQKQGYLIQRGSIAKKADLLIYRSIKTGGIRAFVVSID